MEKKSIFILVIIIIALLAICIMAFNHTSENKFTVGDAEFTLPDGYEVKSNKDVVTIANGGKNFSITSYNDSKIDKHINEYKTSKEKNNKTITVSHITDKNNKQLVKSTVVNATSNVHYWFNYHGKTYTIYTSNAGEDADQTVFKMVSSLDI